MKWIVNLFKKPTPPTPKKPEFVFGDPEMDFYDDGTYLYYNYGMPTKHKWTCEGGILRDPDQLWFFNSDLMQQAYNWFEAKQIAELNRLMLS